MNGGRSTNGGAMAVAAGAVAPGPGLEPAGAGVLPAAERLDGDEDRLGADGERSILQAIAVGDHRGALSLCARYHGPAVGRLCMALVGSQAEADDLAQETLLTAHDGFAAFRGEGSLRAWLFGIARRKCARAVERRVRREARLRLVHDSDRAPPTDELIARRRRAERARAALDAVRPTEREALVLRFVSELSYREVAEACGIDEVAARKRVSRAITRLRAALAEDE